MDQSNGMPVHNGHHELSNTLKEMLRINSSNNSSVPDAVDVVSHDGSGDPGVAKSSLHCPQEFESIDSDHCPPLEDKTDDDDDDLQKIYLDEICDGECVSLYGPHTRIYASSKSELDNNTSASNKVKINTITKFDWEHRYYTGNLLTVTDMYIAYCIKGRSGYSVRVINRHNSSDRVLLKGFTGVVCDVAFAPHAGTHVLAAVDSAGTLLVWSLGQDGGNLVEEKKLHVSATPEMSEVSSSNHRLMWIPHIQRDEEEEGSSYESKHSESAPPKILVLVYGNIAEVWDLDIAFGVADGLPESGASRMELSHSFVAVTGDAGADITDCELSPIGNVLAAASHDGFVKFWQVQIEDPQPPSCLHQWQPHDGKPVSCVKFCDNKKQPENSVFWRFLLTGCERNNELKIWCTVTWDCLQVIDFAPSTPAHAIPELNLVLYLSSDFLVLSDIHRKVLYVMQCKTNIKDGTAQLSSIAQFQLTSPLLSIAFVDAKACKFKATIGSEEHKDAGMSGSDEEDHDEDDEIEMRISSKSGDGKADGELSKLDGFLLKLITIQARSLQSLDVRFITNEEMDNDGLAKSLSTYNTISEDIKDMVSISSLDDNLSPNAAEPDKTIGDQGYMAEEEEGLSKFDQSTQEETDTKSEEKISHDESVDHNQDFQSEASSEEEPVVPDQADAMKVSPDITQSTNQPVLLTPDAFISTFKSPGTVGDSVNSSFTAVTPFSNILVLDPPTNDLLAGSGRDTLPNFMLSPSTVGGEKSVDRGNPSTPPSSPVLPCASSSPAVASDLPYPPRSVKSPDLISSTSTQEVEGARTFDPSASSAALPVSLSSAISRSYSDSGAVAMVHLSESFPQVLRPVISNQWPKAPDVTRPAVARSPPQGSSSLDLWASSETLERSVSNQIQPVPLQLQPVQNHIEPVPNQIQPVETEQATTSINPALSSMFNDIVELLNGVKEDQKSMMSVQQKDMQGIAKKQNQLQKSSDSSLKRTENQIEKLEKSVKSLSDNQKKMSTDLKSMQTGVAEATVAKMTNVVKSEVKRTVLPGLTQTLEPVKEQLVSVVSQKLTATDAVLKESIPKILRSKELVDHIGTSTAKALHGQLQAMLPEIFFTTLIPAFERASQNMFQQLSATYHRGMEEMIVKFEKKMTSHVKPDQDRLQALIKNAYTASTELQNASKQATTDISNLLKDIPGQIEKAYSRCEERMKEQQEAAFLEQRRVISDLVRDVVTRTLEEKLPQSPADPGVLGAGAVAGAQIAGMRPILHRPSIIDQQQQILKLLQQGNVNTAFQTALTASDLSLVMYVCETVDPAVVFGVTPCPLQQPILLSLIQQLSSDLANKTDIKLKYLQEAVMNLDRRHQVTQEYMHSVLSALVQKLNSCLQGPLEKPSISKDLRMLAMAAQSLMK